MICIGGEGEEGLVLSGSCFMPPYGTSTYELSPVPYSRTGDFVAKINDADYVVSAEEGAVELRSFDPQKHQYTKDLFPEGALALLKVAYALRDAGRHKCAMLIMRVAVKRLNTFACASISGLAYKADQAGLFSKSMYKLSERLHIGREQTREVLLATTATFKAFRLLGEARLADLARREYSAELAGLEDQGLASLEARLRLGDVHWRSIEASRNAIEAIKALELLPTKEETDG